MKVRIKVFWPWFVGVCVHMGIMCFFMLLNISVTPSILPGFTMFLILSVLVNAMLLGIFVVIRIIMGKEDF